MDVMRGKGNQSTFVIHQWSGVGGQGNHRFMLPMKSLLNHKMWRLQLFSCWLCCSAPFVIHENILLEVACEIVMWRHECMQATIRQKRGKWVIYLAVISPFFWEIQTHIFSLSVSLFLLSSLYGRKESWVWNIIWFWHKSDWAMRDKFPLCVELNPI